MPLTPAQPPRHALGFELSRPLAAVTQSAQALSFTFPLSHVALGFAAGELRFCTSTCASPTRRLARRGSLSTTR